MTYNAVVLKVMIASPGDVSNERQTVREVIDEWNFMHSEDRGLVLMPIGWETHASPTLGDRPQEIINKQVLSDCDLLVAMFWTRLGTPTGVAASGTVEEIEEHINSGKSAMIYFSSAPVRLESVEDEQYSALRKFKEECSKKGLVETYDSISEFREKLSRQLTQTIIRDYPTNKSKITPASMKSTVENLSDDAKELLAAATKDPTGRISRLRTRGSLIVQASRRNFVTRNDPRSEARWEGVIKELEQSGLIQDHGGMREVFAVTNTGFQTGDLLQKNR